MSIEIAVLLTIVFTVETLLLAFFMYTSQRYKKAMRDFVDALEVKAKEEAADRELKLKRLLDTIKEAAGEEAANDDVRH